MSQTSIQIGTIGGGEAANAIAKTLVEQHQIRVVGFDIKASTDDRCDALNVNSSMTYLSSRSKLTTQANMLLSVVTADDAIVAAEQVAPYLTPQHYFLDGNSVSPETKKKIAKIITASGASYFDMAIMAPINPRGHQTPVLLAGPDEAILAPLLAKFDFCFQWQGPQIGDASLVKMLRSILIKGMESLICECVTAAEAKGLDTKILQSAGKTLGITDMPSLADYTMERVATHGRRRAAELREVAKTLEELGLSNHMPTAIAKHQDMIADMNLTDEFDNNMPKDRAILAKAMRDKQNN